MPELPEVETVLRGLRPIMEGKRFLRVEQRRKNLRFAFPDNFVGRLTGRQIDHMSRRAKYILAGLDNGETLVIHLGMSGRFKINQNATSSRTGKKVDEQTHPHDHVTFHLSDGTSIHYNDVRRFGFMELVHQNLLPNHKLFQDLGVEPLSDRFDPHFLAEKARNRHTSLKSLLMNQKLVAGLGNIYVCEALHRAGLCPQTKAAILSTKNGNPGKAAKNLVDAIKKILDEAIKAGGSTLQDHRQTDGSLGYFQHQFAVYGRAGNSCKKRGCRGTIRRIIQNGRSTFYCPACQT